MKRAKRRPKDFLERPIVRILGASRFTVDSRRPATRQSKWTYSEFSTVVLHSQFL